MREGAQTCENICSSLKQAVTSVPNPKSYSEDLTVCEPPHLKDLHEGQKAVLKRPLVVTVENKRLQQLQDGEHIAKERHVVLLPKLLHV